MQDSSDVKDPGLLMYTKGMPAAVLSNISTLLGIINGAQGRAIRVIPDPDDMYILWESYLALHQNLRAQPVHSSHLTTKDEIVQ